MTAVAAQFGAVRDVYPGRFPRYWYVAVPFLLFGSFLGCAGAPWWIWAAVWVPSACGVLGGLATKANTALYLFDGGLVTTSWSRRVKGCVAWSAVQRVDQRVYPMSHAGPRLVYALRLVGGGVMEVDTDVLRDGPDAGARMRAAVRRAHGTPDRGWESR